jgi:hypothetical protein
MTDVRLEAVDGQDHPAGPGGDPPQPSAVRGGQGQQFVVAVQEVADAARADGHAASGQLGMDLREAAMLGVTQATDRGDDVEAELVLGQGEAALLLGPQADAVSGAVGVAATPDLEA